MTAAKKPGYRDRQGAKLHLGAIIGQGGEAVVYEADGRPDTLAKIYRSTPTDYHQKLAWMIGHPPRCPGSHVVMAWPTDLVFDKAGALKGYLMPRVHGAVPLLIVFNPRKREQLLPNFNRRYRYRAARNLAAALQSAHNAGYVVGDLNESNALVTSTALISLLDTDSFQVRAPHGNTTRLFRSPVGKPEYTAPELQGLSFREVDRTLEHDRFALGVLIFQLLMEGNHPFRLLWHGSGEPPPLEDSILYGWFPYSSATPAVAPPPGAPELNLLDPSLATLVSRCFVDGHTDPGLRPTAAEWQRGLAIAETGLRKCSAGHIYAGHLPACPDCAPLSRQSNVPQTRRVRRPKKNKEQTPSITIPPPPFSGQPSPIEVSTASPHPKTQAVPAKKRPSWLVWAAVIIAVILIRNAMAAEETNNQSMNTSSARATSTARARAAGDPLSPTAAPNLAPRPGGLTGNWGGTDEFTDRSTVEASDFAGVSLEVVRGRLLVEVSNPDQFYWLSYTDSSTSGRDFGLKADISKTSGDGEVFLLVHSVSANTDWAFAVNPSQHRWQLYSAGPDNSFVAWNTSRDYSQIASGELKSIELLMSGSHPALLVNGFDVVQPLNSDVPRIAGDLVTGFGVATARAPGATMAVEFDRIDLYERRDYQ